MGGHLQGSVSRSGGRDASYRRWSKGLSAGIDFVQAAHGVSDKSSGEVLTTMLHLLTFFESKVALETALCCIVSTE